MKTLEPDLARVIRALGVKELNTVQQTASRKGLYSTTGDYALVSQSRTGKSFAGTLFVANEMYKELCKDTEAKVLSLFIAPFHASARETSALISSLFGWLLRPLVLIGEFHQSELALRLSKDLSPNVLVTTPDALRDIIRDPKTRQWLEQYRIVTTVFDDVHAVLHDPARGSALIEISGYLQNKLSQKPRVLVLSAKFDDPARLEKIFNTKLVLDKTRYDPPEFNLVKYSKPSAKKELVQQTLEELADQGRRTLVYMKTIQSIHESMTEQADNLAELIAFDMDPLVRARLERIGRVLEKLDYPYVNLYNRGIGCYHGQMEEEHRWFVEWAFRRKHLRLLFGTEALAYGVNTPVSNVVMESPGIDEIFRQSMMARAVRMRRGEGSPGTVTVFTKSIKDAEALSEVYCNPSLPLRFFGASHLSRLMIGLIGLGLLTEDSHRQSLSDSIGLLFKKGSTSRAMRELQDPERPFVQVDKSGHFALTSLGYATMKSGLSAEQARAILLGLDLILKEMRSPTAFDFLLLINMAITLDMPSGKRSKELNSELERGLKSKVDSVLLTGILNTELESKWQRAIEYSALLIDYFDDSIRLESATRKTTARLLLDVRRFAPRFEIFLEYLIEDGAMSEKGLKPVLKALSSKEVGKVLSEDLPDRGSLRHRDLSFVNFDDIEMSIDLTLASDLDAGQKIQLLDLLDTVESTTAALVDLLTHSGEDPDAQQALQTMLQFSKEGRVGTNLLKVLEEEGLVERGTADHLWNSFTKRVEDIQKRTDAPASAAKVLIALFSGDVVGMATSGYKAVKIALGRVKGKVDTSGLG